MSNDFLAKGDVIVGALLIVSGIIFHFQKPRPGKERQMQFLSFGLFFGGVALLLQHWLLPNG